jgi:hypothetical protein
MKISGFTMVKNGVKLYYPVKESIASILPVVDEFIVALGDCDEDDTTRDEILSLNSDKVKIIDTVWDLKKYPNGMENAHQTDVAKNACSGDWLIYLQADEVIHEKYLDTIKTNCEKYFKDDQIEAFLLNYIHFFGDYWHHQINHGWYQREIRIVRNNPDIHSFASAQSFRRIPDFDGVSYRDREGSFKLRVKHIDAYVYHYGWVRPPHFMQNKSKALDTIHKGQKTVDEMYSKREETYYYGPLGRLGKFSDTHPKVMEEMIARFDWKEQLDYGKKFRSNREKMKSETFKYRFWSWVEQTFNGGKHLFTSNNWEIID